MAVKLELARIASNVGVTRGIRLNYLVLRFRQFLNARPRYPFRLLSEKRVRC